MARVSNRAVGSATDQQPRSGILVDCKPSHGQVPGARPTASLPALSPSASSAQQLGERLWSVLQAQLSSPPMAAAFIGLLFLLSLTSGAVLLCRASAPELGPSANRSRANERGTADWTAVAQRDDDASTNRTAGSGKAKAMPPADPACPAAVVKKWPAAPEPRGILAEALRRDVAVPLAEAAPDMVEPIRTAADTCVGAPAGKGSGDFLGTAVTFVSSPKVAGIEAFKQHKLLFVLHVSGNFEDPGFT